MVVGMMVHLRNFSRSLPPRHERPTSSQAVLTIPLSDIHPVSLLFAVWPNPCLEASPSKTSQPGRPPIPPTRHPRGRLFVRSLDDITTFGDQAHERRDEQPYVESWNVEE
jgi:hypothetical protein